VTRGQVIAEGEELYRALGLPAGCSDAEIARAFRHRAAIGSGGGGGF
jgi:hypothetical protein